ncbi:MAG TPA: glycosyltransferase family 2 protein [Verrucomicrobiae bacterium]|nr:glycosyltransferase family 2 protein [Verrucomicrobiae bacterium]
MQTALQLSVAIITMNEERNLPRCLESVRGLAAEIVVIDSGSTDKTQELARQHGARVEVHPWQGHVAQKSHALRRCTQPWVLNLDADEALSPELAASIRALFAGSGPNEDGFWVNRRTFYLGDWIRHAWYPEWRLRLVRRERADVRGLDPHERLLVDGPTARLQGDLLHYSFRDLRDHLERTIRYARIMADSYASQGRSFRWSMFVFSPWYAFFKRLVLKQGWRDGWRGWMIAFVSFFSSFAKSAFLLEKQLTGASKPTDA